VGDNENDTAVFLYPLSANGVEATVQTALNIRGVEIGDIEAIAKLAEDRVLIMGSHSRNTKCEVKKKRLRFVQAKIGKDILDPLGPMVEMPAIHGANLFDSATLASNTTLDAVSKAITAAETAADRAQGDKKACEQANAFNIEGAVALVEGRPAPEVWIGLRSPLVKSESGPDNAVLLQMVSLDTFRLSGAAYLQLGGRGIRELTRDQGWIWGIAGGPQDDQDNFVLWRIRQDALKPNATLTPEIVRPLPASSEGLAIVEQTAYVLLDGDKGEEANRCKVAGRYVQLDLRRTP
jgi:hypothetical protein